MCFDVYVQSRHLESGKTLGSWKVERQLESGKTSCLQRFFDAWGEIPFFRKQFTYPTKVSDDLCLVIYTKLI